MGFRIELVNQDDDVSCIAACIAMVSGESLKHVKKTLGDTDKGLLDVLIGLKKFNLYGNLQAFPVLLIDRVYTLTTPSLNFPGKNHQVVVTTFDNEMKVFDPQYG